MAREQRIDFLYVYYIIGLDIRQTQLNHIFHAFFA